MDKKKNQQPVLFIMENPDDDQTSVGVTDADVAEFGPKVVAPVIPFYGKPVILRQLDEAEKREYVHAQMAERRMERVKILNMVRGARAMLSAMVEVHARFETEDESSWTKESVLTTLAEMSKESNRRSESALSAECDPTDLKVASEFEQVLRDMVQPALPKELSKIAYVRADIFLESEGSDTWVLALSELGGVTAEGRDRVFDELEASRQREVRELAAKQLGGTLVSTSADIPADLDDDAKAHLVQRVLDGKTVIDRGTQHSFYERFVVGDILVRRASSLEEALGALMGEGVLDDTFSFGFGCPAETPAPTSTEAKPPKKRGWFTGWLGGQ